jgi:aryl-alcohol dehydrogenase-like predicted oxidoreductase
MPVERRSLGDSGISVPSIALGTVKFGRNSGVKYPTGFELPGDDTIVDLLTLARQHGINLIDTAPAYGSSEERIGQLLPGKRTDWLLSTKAGEIYEDGESRFDFSGDAIIASVERSLDRLNTDYLDIVLVHSDGNDSFILEETDALAALAELKAKGLIRLTGMSTKTVEGGLKTLDVADVVMVTYNPTATSDRAVIETARQKGKGVLVKKALVNGHGDAAECLQFALAEPGVSSVVLGTINSAHLQQNIQVATTS